MEYGGSSVLTNQKSRLGWQIEQEKLMLTAYRYWNCDVVPAGTFDV